MAVREEQVRQATPLGAAIADRGIAVPSWLKWGTALGLVQLFAMVTVGPLGVSTAYPQLVGYVGNTIFPGFASSQPYLRIVKATIGWEVLLVFGLFLGAFAARWLHDRRGADASGGQLRPVCVEGFEGRRALRLGRAFLGGFLFIFGARLAGGCTSGHILSGLTQMALSGFVFAAAVFASGRLTAALLFREPAR